MPHTDQTARFFNLLYGECELSPSSALPIWTGRGQRTAWMTDLGDAAKRVAEVAPQRDTYFGVCLQDVQAAHEAAAKKADEKGLTGSARERRVAFARGSASTAAVVPGVWLDIDFGTEGHEKEALPPNAEAAMGVIEKMPLVPSLIVHTGGGYHAYWIFHEPFAIETKAERLSLASIVRGWNALARDLARNQGFTTDSTWDLARVLRPVGSINHKHGGHVVRVEAERDERYNPSDFDEWTVSVADIARERTPLPGEANVKLKAVRECMDADALPPADMLQGMLEMHAKFAATWHRTRTDLPSQSEYDMALAMMVAHAGWEDRDIIALLIQHRKAGHQALKLDRPDYYHMTLSAVRRSVTRSEAEEEIATSAEAGSLQPPGEEPESLSAAKRRGGLLRKVSVVLGVRIEAVLHYRSSLATQADEWSLRVEGREFSVGGVATILDPRLFRIAVAGATEKAVPKMKADRWEPLAQALLAATTQENLGADSEPGEVLRETVIAYLKEQKPNEDRGEALASRMPTLDADRNPAFFLASFKTWLHARGERMSQYKLAQELRLAGGHVVRLEVLVNASDGSQRVSRPRMWVCPFAKGQIEVFKRPVKE